jgi:hypothetical protein
MKTKNQKLATKMLPGHVERRRVRCGKPNCKCARGETHVAYYHVWHSDGIRFRRFIPARIVEDVRRGCDEYRGLQASLRAGRAEYRDMIRRGRELISFLTGARRAGHL